MLARKIEKWSQIKNVNTIFNQLKVDGFNIIFSLSYHDCHEPPSGGWKFSDALSDTEAQTAPLRHSIGFAYSVQKDIGLLLLLFPLWNEIREIPFPSPSWKCG